MDATTISQSLSDLMANFHKRMDSFEGKLQKTTASSSIEPIASEYAAFKNFVIISLRALQDQIKCLAQETDRQEMRSRRKILLIHGLTEEPQEALPNVVTKFIIERMKLGDFSGININRCHRMGHIPSSGKPRPILCKFRDIDIRDKIWSIKTCLKGSGVTISEFLTKPRYNIFMAARQRFGMAKCWTKEGNIYILGSDGARHRVSCLSELDAIPNEVPKMTEVKEVKEVTVPVAKSKRTTSRK